MQKLNTVTDIGQLIRATRIKQRLRQKDLAAAAGLGIRFIRELEQGKETCHIGKAIYVLKILGIDLFATKRGMIIKELYDE